MFQNLLQSLGTVPKVGGSAVAAPSAPVATAASSITATGLTANWNAASGATSYRLDVSTVSNFASFVSGFNDRNVANVTTFPVTGLTGGTTYYFRVRAVNAGGTSGQSNTITTLTIPAAPAGLGSSSIVSSTATVSWSATTGAASYRLDVATDSGFVSILPAYSNLTVAGTSQGLTGLTGSTPYYFRVRAVNASGTSANSSTASFVTLSSLLDSLAYYTPFETSGSDTVPYTTNTIVENISRPGSSEVVVPGIVNNGWHLSGNAFDYLISDALDNWLLTRPGGSTFSIWVNLETVPTDNTNLMGVWNESSQANSQWSLFFAFGETHFRYTESDSTPGDVLIDAGPSTGVWYLYNVRFNPATNRLRVSINGTTVLNSIINALLDGVNVDSGYRFFITNDNSFTNCITGSIDEFAFHQRELTDAEITQMWNGGAGVTDPFS